MVSAQQLNQPASVTSFFLFSRGENPLSEGTVAYPCEADDSLLAAHTSDSEQPRLHSVQKSAVLWLHLTSKCYLLPGQHCTVWSGQRLQEGFSPASSHGNMASTLILCFVSNSHAVAWWHWLGMGHIHIPLVVKFTCDLLVG